MLRLQGLTLRRGTKLLLESASLSVFPGQKIGIVGPNGSGKSSLFALLRGELLPDAGEIDLPRDWVLAHVAQEVPDLERGSLDFVIDGDAELRQLESDLAREDADGHRIGELHARIADIEGHSARSRAASLMAGLGFSPDDHDRSVREFSGGWRVRLQLARALMCRSDLLLLDEPTNHLDLDAVFWLESWLRAYRGTLLVISHDREFLDNVVQGICHFDQGTLRSYAGGYSAFERTRAEVLSHQQALYEKQQRQIEHLEAFVRRFRAKATKARQAQSRLKALDRMSVIAQVQATTPFEFEFADPGGFADPLLSLEKVGAAYGESVVLEAVDCVIRPGARIGLLGRNGAGKSTLVRLIAGTLTPTGGQRLLGRDVRIGYFAQHQVEQLRSDDSALGHLARLDPRAREQDLRDFLGGFNFRGDAVLAAVDTMSGGERARLALALITYSRPHLLLLDEPTNHLDMEMRNALALALQSFTGAMVLVSHDRALLRTTVDDLWLVADRKVRPFDGDLDEYRAWLEAAAAPERDPAGRAPDGTTRKEQKRVEAEARQRAASARKPIEQRLKQVESAMSRHEERLRALEARLAAPDIYDAQRKDELKAGLLEQSDVRRELEALEEEWLALHEKLEAVVSG
ncbi:MAG: ATP-binding cassette domain-containing protein [Betaproteobacteria bacterium]|nr:ATP-binding cassette domain-containing protein [Betaproteobacteria bacterium]